VCPKATLKPSIGLTRWIERRVTDPDIWDEIGWTDPDRRESALLRLAYDIVHKKADLSPSEIRVLKCMSNGLTIGMTAEMLVLSNETIQSQTASARLKLGAKNTMHACCIALRKGLIT
jgi:DNA-binding NarL/FixJ family response regulator